MNPTEQSKLIREICVFALKRRGKCFEGWSANKVFKFFAWHYLNGTLFIVRQGESLSAIGIAWKTSLGELFRREREKIPTFDWSKLPDDGDSILVADVIGNRNSCATLWKVFCDRFPKSETHKAFTYRKNKLVEIKGMSRFLSISPSLIKDNP